jgi:Pectate lyase superfamily protein
MTKKQLLTLALCVMALLILPSRASAWNNGPDAGNGFGTHDWILQQADRLAVAQGASWLDLDYALQFTDDPDTVLKDSRYHTYDVWGEKSGLAPARISACYRSAMSSLAAGDVRSASKTVGLLSHYYADICSPLHTDQSRRERTIHAAYERKVQSLTSQSGENERWATFDGFDRVGNITQRSIATATAAHRSYTGLVSNLADHGYNSSVATITRRSLARAVNGLADIIETLDSARLKDVRAYGAKGDGSADDTAALRAALKAAAAAGTGVYVPTGVYRVGTLAIPNGVTVRGEGSDASWLKGGIVFGSYDLVRGLRLGDVGKRTHNEHNATQTVFESCRFRGTVPIMLGNDHSCSYITFRDCEVERSFGTWNSEGSFSDIIVEEYSPGPYGHVTHITFKGCHIGVSNGSGGHDTGSPAAGLVAHCNPAKPINQGYQDIKIIDCVFEATDEFTLDFADMVKADGLTHSSRGVLIEGCTIKGGGYQGPRYWPYSICVESPEGVTVRDNVIYRSYSCAFKICMNEDPDPDRASLVVEGNTFDLTYDNGITPRSGISLIRLAGDNNIFRDNVVRTKWSNPILKLGYCRHSKVTANEIYDLRESSNPLLADVEGAAFNTVSSNYFWTAGSGGLRIYSYGGSHDNVWTDNLFVRQ